MLVSTAIRRWLETKKRWTPKVKQYVSMLAEGWEHLLGGMNVHEVRPMDIDALRSERDNGERSTSALNQERMYFKMFWRWVRREYRGIGDVTEDWPKLREVIEKEYIPLTEEEEDRLIECAEEPWLKRYIRVAARTGLREGSLRSLIWMNVWDDSLTVKSEHWKGRFQHKVPIGRLVQEALGPRADNISLVFKDLPGPATVWRAFKRAAQKAGLKPGVNVHDLRRTFFARLRQWKIPIEDARVLGGLRTLSVLLKHYYKNEASPESQQILRNGGA